MEEVGKVKLRTQDQIIADCETRMAEIEQEAARRRDFEQSPIMQFPCSTCRWADPFKAAWCHQPLVKGFGEKFHLGTDDSGIARKVYPPLCGPEKALWEQKLSRWQRFIDWLFK